MKTTFCKLISLLMLSAFTAGAQLTVEEITTDSINLFAENKETFKSSKLAMSATVLLPGLGHQYLGRSNSALAYLSMDLLAFFGAVFCEQYSRKLQSEAKDMPDCMLQFKTAKKMEDSGKW